jgi:hypothetical protein
MDKQSITAFTPNPGGKQKDQIHPSKAKTASTEQ